jgi:predicted dehydrogenase
MYPGLASRVSVYAQLGPDVLDYLNRISLFNSRRDNPTRWEMDVHLREDAIAEMLRERPGNVVVFAGRNRGKIDHILASLAAGLNVLADKPWIISSSEMPKLEEALALADSKHLAAYDIMTERYEVTSELQRVFVNDAEIFGKLERGTASDPGVHARSVHHVMKIVAGVPLRRPAWFFDIAQYGEGLADVGTHVVDLVQWTAFPDHAIDYRRDIQMFEGHRWQLPISREQFTAVTGEADFPDVVRVAVHQGKLDYYCNNAVHYTLRGIQVKLEIVWDWEAPEGTGDVYEAAFRGTKSRVEIRQTKTENHIPELYIVPASGVRREDVFKAVRKKVAALQTQWPGLAVAEVGEALRIVVPEIFRVGHEDHFAQVTNRFFDYLKSPGSMPAWERANMLAKYWVSTKGVESIGAGH